MTRIGQVQLEAYRIKELKDQVDMLCLEIISGISEKQFREKEEKLKEYCMERFPEKSDLYHLIYRSRFNRLWQQFRGREIEFEEEKKEDKN